MKIEINSKSALGQKLEITDINDLVAVSVTEEGENNASAKTMFLNQDQLPELINGLTAAYRTSKSEVDG